MIRFFSDKTATEVEFDIFRYSETRWHIFSFFWDFFFCACVKIKDRLNHVNESNRHIKKKKKTKTKTKTKQKQNKTKQNKTKQNKTKQNKTKQNKTKQNKTKQKQKQKPKTKNKQNKTNPPSKKAKICGVFLN